MLDSNADRVQRCCMHETLVSVAASYMPLTAARELIANVAGYLPEDVTVANVQSAIERRRRHFGLVVRGTPASAAVAIVAMYNFKARQQWLETIFAELDAVAATRS